jgi:hypothetical protein
MCIESPFVLYLLSIIQNGFVAAFLNKKVCDNCIRLNVENVRMKHIHFLLILLCSFSALTAQTQERLPCIDKKFSVVIHIVVNNQPDAGITEAQIKQNINLLNDQFAPICASFEVCEFQYINNSYYDTVKNANWKEMQALYNVKNRINIYYVTEVSNPNDNAGFADTAGITHLTADGIVLKKSSTPRILFHQMGHYFGLLHTFEGGTELANGSNSTTAGDKIGDTPADPYVMGADPSQYVNQNCKFIYMGTDANGQYFNPLTGNIMSLYPESCFCGFTHDQYMKMAKTYLANPAMW